MGQGQSREIKNRIGSVKNTQKITSAMKLVSSSKLAKATKELRNFKPYVSGISDILGKVVTKSTFHPMINVNNSKNACVVVYAGEKALCGAFNSGIIKEAIATGTRLENEGWTVKYFAIGKKAKEGLMSASKEIIETHLLKTPLPTKEFTAGIAAQLVDLFSSQEYGQVHIAYTEFKSAGSRATTSYQLLPFVPEDEEAPVIDASSDENFYRTRYLFEPSKDDIIEELFSIYFGSEIHRCYLDSLASEYGARMIAMDNAAKNAKEMIDALTLKLNRARQAAITQEIAEIVGGAASLGS
ncbi:MAG: ATP synthase F1 subunit gamma [Candidatus Cloacimonadota bacterium]|nr:MAG: ATP synthase F1 subunit gamma [Candidatus Cloacimonadota bacterium]